MITDYGVNKVALIRYRSQLQKQTKQKGKDDAVLCSNSRVGVFLVELFKLRSNLRLCGICDNRENGKMAKLVDDCFDGDTNILR